MQALQGFFSAQRIACEAFLVVNDAFREIVLDTIIAVATDVADTAELFLRSYQLLSIFEPAANRTAGSRATGRSDADDGEVLRFEFDPSPADAFKAQLLDTKMARMTIHYQDGRTENRIWTAENFKESANLLGNLRSRQQFRKGEWQHG